ncbi:SNF1-related protein kinase regulatory subunit beta-1-like [Triticum dicoccoides]|uniref:Association with the SNF1 complex (ASC) domain-containing protein n=1 Tax=Triticum turgidum subsp. durum TaxID=4567 RepID=A0A9R0T310_TRITD|nr:SNF1-related protein kinase regulatory subunit beta-1-like [Triticum dicoccoides]VAI06228.1 unnamed protein product [Triticum turgidum subsp. durum]
MGNASGREEDAAAPGEADAADVDVEDGGDDSSARGFPPYGGGANHVRRACSVGVVGASGGPGSPPVSPGRSLSPRMFVPQTPVPPLQRPADVTPVFNEILMNEQEEEFDGPPQKEIPALIVWTLGGKNVSVEGSWDNWKSRKPMQKSGKDHSLLLILPSGVYRYRFVVDGERRCFPDLPCETDAMGNAVNLLDVHDFVPESVESVSEFEAPPSPESSYSFQAPEEKDFAKEPPALPSQLHLGVLNSQNSEEICARPQHIVLNHLFIEKGWGAHPLVALGVTHRFESKYVTVVLYKPIER